MNPILRLVAPDQCESLFQEHGVSNVDDLAAKLATQGVTLIDDTCMSEYTQCNAQNSVDFAAESLTLEELDELESRSELYK